jgi:hypothetical protein
VEKKIVLAVEKKRDGNKKRSGRERRKDPDGRE